MGIFTSLCRSVYKMASGAGSGDFSKIPSVVFVLGGPGAGKGTQCDKVVKEFGYVHLCAGDLLREERRNPNSEVGELIENYIREGKIVPVEITCALLLKAMKTSGRSEFLIDGFPRNQDNVDGWTRETAGGKANVKFVIFFDCDKETCVNRCLSRGQAGSGRSDDNLDSLNKRFETYITSTLPIIEHYDKLGLVRRIDSSQTTEQVYEAVRKLFLPSEENR